MVVIVWPNFWTGYLVWFGNLASNQFYDMMLACCHRCCCRLYFNFLAFECCDFIMCKHVITVFVVVLPPGCEFFKGPNSRLCYSNLWQEVGCISFGEQNPAERSESDITLLQLMDLL